MAEPLIAVRVPSETDEALDFIAARLMVPKHRWVKRAIEAAVQVELTRIAGEHGHRAMSPRVVDPPQGGVAASRIDNLHGGRSLISGT